MIADYTERNLPEQLAKPEGKAIVDLVDPYSYRAHLTMPKLILLGTNDPYWPVDALTLYFPGLPGEKNVHYVPNGDHGLGPGAVEALAAFYADVIAGRPRPRFEWEFERGNPGLTLTVDAEDAPVRAEVCRASAPTRDFRKARWTSEPLVAENAGAGTGAGRGGPRFVAKTEASKDSFGAIFARLFYRSAIGQEYALSTTLEVLEPTTR
jgi:PhoPQ-activated pathogenicity-related protein